MEKLYNMCERKNEVSKTCIVTLTVPKYVPTYRLVLYVYGEKWHYCFISADTGSFVLFE